MLPFCNYSEKLCCEAAAEGEGKEEKAAEEEADGQAVKRPAEEEVGFKKMFSKKKGEKNT